MKRRTLKKKLVSRRSPATKKRAVARREVRNQYFEDDRATEFFSTGCMLLDCALGFGWPVGKIINIVGDKSTGKTQLAVEAFANFCRHFPEGYMDYMEAEAAFDIPYAQKVGLPVDRLMIHDDIDTVEQFFKALEKICDRKESSPTLVVLDSLDSLSDAEELNTDVGKSSSMAKKARLMSQLFRRLVRKCKASRTTVIIISQVRDKINVMFGRKHTRSGGKALDFYAALVLYLAEVGKIYKTKTGIKRPIGVKIKAKVDKNKVAEPFRECQFPIIFNYGIDDIQAAIDWLVEVGEAGVLEDIGLGKKPTSVRIEKVTKEYGFNELRKELGGAVRDVWQDIEKEFGPTRSKYQ